MPAFFSPIAWCGTSTPGGGVAEMLQTLLAYGLGAGVDTRWLVLDGDPAFFAITKRIHNALHGSVDGVSGFDASEHEHYERVLDENLSTLTRLVRPGDIVLLHDPQTAGLIEGIRETRANVIWRSHIGRDDPNPTTERGWDFLRGYLENADAFVFSRQRYVPHWVPPDRVRVIAPSIDPFSAKNRELDDLEVSHVLHRVGLIAGGDGSEAVDFTRRDGTAGVVRRHTDLLWGSEPPPADAPLVVQVSRLGQAQGHDRRAVGLRRSRRARHAGRASDARGPRRIRGCRRPGGRRRSRRLPRRVGAAARCGA
ncbi:MAG TPA: hypothetical protein VF317_01170 [Dermatophilaceae bacterium]